ncbi:MAG TPA: hypothetical protein DCE42_07245, partial [Myxococcales bacterium]|nr:hypothetical protein [Myxococcales bacterium]
KCGDGTCDAAQGENCSTCTKDCPCPQNSSCQSGVCNGCLCFPGQLKCEGTKLSLCSADCKSWTLKETCAAGSNCDATKGQCISPCGDGNCDAASNENCQTCAKDCQCAANQLCNGFQCVNACGDGKCNAGENCTTCPQDCACPGGAQCQNGACCTCTPGTIKCDGDALKTCKADCTGWESKQCKSGCQNKQCCACPEGKRRCSGDTVQECTCKEWKQVDKCGTFEKCKSGKCKFSLW